MTKIVLKLYILGRTSRTERAVENLSRVLGELPDTEHELIVCDVLEQPQAAEDDKILATPTLILMSPPPSRRVVGDFADTENVFLHLGLTPRPPLKQMRPE